MENSKQAFRDYLALEKHYSMHTVNGYWNDLVFFETFLKDTFDQEDLTEVNYGQIRSWIVSLVDASSYTSPLMKSLTGEFFALE